MISFVSENVLSCFTEFSFDDLAMNAQQFEDYKSKYLDLYDKVRTNRQKEKISILEDIDFELELIHRDEINVSYIIALLRNMQVCQTGRAGESNARRNLQYPGDRDTTSQQEGIDRTLHCRAFPRDSERR